MSSIDKLKLSNINGFYINLEIRKDRMMHVEKELKEMGMSSIQRFNAVKTSDGAVGCSVSHIACLKKARSNKWDYVLICEDDIHFLNKSLFKEQYEKFINSDIDWDVLLIAGNVVGPYKEVEDFCVKVSLCQTTTGYIVKKSYYDTLIENISKGVNELIKKNDPRIYAIDQYWFKLQQKDNWYLITPLTITQKTDYSNIEHRIVKYDAVMLNLNKPAIFKNDPELFLSTFSP